MFVIIHIVYFTPSNLTLSNLSLQTVKFTQNLQMFSISCCENVS